jgi:putative endonuclease
MALRFHVYIMSSAARVLYTGQSHDLPQRVWQHREGQCAFTARWGIRHLVHMEEYSDPRDAVARERQLKKWHRWQKVALIERGNPEWFDLAAPMFGEGEVRVPRGGDGGRGDSSIRGSERRRRRRPSE